MTTFSFARGPEDTVEVRTTMIDGDPWFIATDVIKILGISNAGVAYQRLDLTERTNICRTDLGEKPGRPMTLVSEAGLYKLIMRSDKPEALVFQNWIASEVLPSIRKTGSYALADHGREAMPLPMDIAEAIAVAVGQAMAPEWPGTRCGDPSRPTGRPCTLRAT